MGNVDRRAALALACAQAALCACAGAGSWGRGEVVDRGWFAARAPLAPIAPLAPSSPAFARASAAAVSAQPLPASSAAAGDCAFLEGGAPAAGDESCRACHLHNGSASHAVDVDYRLASSASPSELRPAEEVLRRGVALPGGQVRCATCHDRRSPWKHRLALPADAALEAAVDPRERRTWSTRARAAPRALMAGDAVSARPLCLACHALD